MNTQQALAQILQENGFAILDDHNKVHNLLSELAPYKRRQNLALTTCLEYGFHHQFLTKRLKAMADILFAERGLDRALVLYCLDYIIKLGPYDVDTILYLELEKKKSFDVNLIYNCILNGANCNTISKTYRRTALHLAVKFNHVDLAKLLIEKGADIEAANPAGWTALHFTAWLNRYEIAQLLIEAGAKIEARGVYSWTPLHRAACYNRVDVARLLIENGADIEAKTKDGRTALHLAAQGNSLKLAKLLIENGADVDAKDKVGRTVLHHSAHRNSYEVAKLLIEMGATVDLSANDGLTSLHLAIHKGNLDVARILLEKGASIRAITKSGKTAIDFASYNREQEAIHLLVEYGSSPPLRDLISHIPYYFGDSNQEKISPKSTLYDKIKARVLRFFGIRPD
jgi:ankyrin repeat protein